MKKEIERSRTYIKGLEEAIAMPQLLCDYLLEVLQDLDVSESFLKVMGLWRRFGSFLNGVVYVYNNRFVWEERQRLLNVDAFNQPLLMNDELFSVLKRLSKYTVIDFLSVLPLKADAKLRLHEAVMNEDFESFNNLIAETECDTTLLARLCAQCIDDSSIVFDMNSLEDLQCYYDTVELNLKDNEDNDSRVVVEGIRKMQPVISDLQENEDEDELWDRYSECLLEFLSSTIPICLYYYWDWYDDFVFQERRLLNIVLKHPDLKEMVNNIRESYDARNTVSENKLELHLLDTEQGQGQNVRKAENAIEDSIGDVEYASFSLAKDFFDVKNKDKESNKDEYYKISDIYRQDGWEKILQDLINWLANEGYISEDKAVKELFAYRMTGYCRPEHLNQIEWHGRNEKSHELIYLIKHLPIKADYKKMKTVFTGPDWVEKCDSSYAELADTDFKRKLNELYGKKS